MFGTIIGKGRVLFTIVGTIIGKGRVLSTIDGTIIGKVCVLSLVRSLVDAMTRRDENHSACRRMTTR